MATKTWTLVWAWYSNPGMEQREIFTSRDECWKRVQEIMALRSEAARMNTGSDRVSVLEVYTDRADDKPGVEISTFKVYMPGPYQKWGDWGMSKSITTGVLCG